MHLTLLVYRGASIFIPSQYLCPVVHYRRASISIPSYMYAQLYTTEGISIPSYMYAQLYTTEGISIPSYILDYSKAQSSYSMG